MVITAFDRLALYDEHVYLPFTRYVITDASYHRIAKSLAKANGSIVSSSCFNSRERITRARIKNRKVAIYRHTAFGDQLIMTGLTQWLHIKWPDARIFYACSPMVGDIWRWNPTVEYIGQPMTLEFVDSMTDHIFFEGMFENDSEPDQLNCYDAMFRRAGFDPRNVPTKFKRPHLYFNQQEEKFHGELRGKHGDFIVYHWSSSNPNRMYPPAQSIATLQLLSEAFAWPICVVGTCIPEEKEEYVLPPGCVDMRNATPKFRTIINYVAASTLVIGPDSSVVHVAGALAKPCISLWGLFHPNDRIKYYENTYPIVGFSACPHAPCRNHDFQLPDAKCADAGNTISPPEFCNALRSITPLQIVQKAYTALSQQNDNTKQSVSVSSNSGNQSIPQTGGAEVSTVRGTEMGEEHLIRRNP